MRIKWRDDFSAARNACLEAARCPWILSLDTDEVLGPCDSVPFSRLLAARPNTAFVFRIRNYFISQDQPGSNATVRFRISSSIRLFPNRIRYCYPVHESLLPALRSRRIRVRRFATPIHHFGALTSASARADKHRYYAALGLKKLLQYGGHFRSYFEMGNLLLSEGDLPSAEAMFQRAIQLNPAFSQAYYFLGLAQYRRGQFEDALASVNRGVRTLQPFSGMPAFMAQSGNTL
jgi:tetratricopeptide (TPR) repeat protein